MIHRIYGLYSTENEIIRYVGETTQELKTRLCAHKCDAITKKSLNHRCNWIRNVYERGYEVEIIQIDVAREDNWEEKERFWISEYRKKCKNLTNELDGGNSGGPGARRKEYLSYEEAKKLMLENNIKTLKEYKVFYKKMKDEGKNILPASAKEYYTLRGEWSGAFHFFGKEGLTDMQKHDNFLPYEEARDFIKKLNFKDRNEYRKYVRENKIAFLPVKPEHAYKDVWVSMYEFLGKEKNILYSYEEARDFVRSNGIKTAREYFTYRKENDAKFLPQHPERDYDAWVSWGEFLGNGHKPKHYKKRAKGDV